MIKFASKVKKLIHTKRDSDNSHVVQESSKLNNNQEVDIDNYSIFSEEQEEDLPSSDSESEASESEQEDAEFSLFPKPIVVDNTLSVNSTAVPCSYNETNHHTQPTANFMNNISTQFHNNFMNSDSNNNLAASNNLLLSSIVSPNASHNKYFTNSISFNHTNSYPSAKSIFSPQSLRTLPNDEHYASSHFSGTPQMIPPAISSFNNHNSNILKQDNGSTNSPSITASKSNDISPVSSNGNGTDVLPENFQLPEGVNYICHYCDASFQVRGYLSRHIKKHAIVKEYTCPYYRHVNETKSFMEHNLKTSYYKNDEDAEDARKKFQSMKHVCHNHNGEFWRKDTLMIHLKKKHYSVDRNTLKLVLEQKKLEQGPNVKSKPKIDATKLPGTCICCNERFANADDFCNNHVLAGSCAALPNGYSIKTNLDDEDEKKKNNKCVLKLIKFSNNDARFIFTKSAVVEPEVFSNREVIDLIVDMAERKTPKSNVNTPAFGDSNKLTSTTSNNSNGGNVLSPQSSNGVLSPMQQSLGMRNASPNGSASSNGPLSHQSAVDTPIVEKLNDNRIVIHPDQVIPIDANKKRKKRRSKKEMEAYREKLAKEKQAKEMMKTATPQRVEIPHLLNHPQQQPMQYSMSGQQANQLQLLMQIYQQQNMLMQQQMYQSMRGGDDDYQALDDDHYTTGVEGDYSPQSNKSGTTAQGMDTRRSESDGSQKTYANKDLNTGYAMGMQGKVDDDEEGLSMDGGF